ncbi:hypothetical protein GTP56_13055 [Duganella sp. FT134W]|uniref:Uncharacterized protein n=1 Tax=Duganella margarita TaxID=2692170 RepID=A0A7X4KHE1_9BURK|nr:hypothetical protein [Duganella margarita]MYM73117.1 hypothetical protein [Duganella margarita]
MNHLPLTPGLAKLHHFFQDRGMERLNGLDKSYFYSLSDDEKIQAWNFLSDNFKYSSDKTTGLFLLDSARAVTLFKDEVQTPLERTEYKDQCRVQQENRILMLHYILLSEPNEKYIKLMDEFGTSEFEEVRTLFAQFLPTINVPTSSLDILKGMIFTETETLPQISAITKFMEVYGRSFELNDPNYKSLFRALLSDNEKEINSAIYQIEQGA